MRAYPGSGCAAAISDANGNVALHGVGAEPLILGLGRGWMFAEVNYTDRYPIHGLQPVLYSRKAGTFVVYRKCQATIRALALDSDGSISSCYSVLRFTSSSTRLRIASSSVGQTDLGLSRERFPYQIYRGSGVYAFPVMQAGWDTRIEAYTGFFGFEQKNCELLVVADGDPAPAVEDVPVTRFARTGPLLGTARFALPEGVFEARPASLLCGARLHATDPAPTRWSYAQVADDRLFDVQLPPGEFAGLSFGHPSVGLCKSGPFSIVAGRSTDVTITHHPKRLLELHVRVWDDAGRPLPEADVTVSVDDAAPAQAGVQVLKNVGSSELERMEGKHWPILALIRVEEAFDASMRPRDLYVTVNKPGFMSDSALVLLDPRGPPQSVDFRMLRAGPGQWER